jgi:hypothetical protein
VLFYLATKIRIFLSPAKLAKRFESSNQDSRIRSNTSTDNAAGQTEHYGQPQALNWRRKEFAATEYNMQVIAPRSTQSPPHFYYSTRSCLLRVDVRKTEYIISGVVVGGGITRRRLRNWENAFCGGGDRCGFVHRSAMYALLAALAVCSSRSQSRYSPSNPLHCKFLLNIIQNSR